MSFHAKCILFFRSTLILLAMVTAASLSGMNEARALMATPYPLEPTRYEDFVIFSRALAANGIAIDGTGNTFSRSVSFREGDFAILRNESSSCVQDRCLTFIFSKSDSGLKLLTAAMLPKRVAMTDWVNEICAGCGNIYGFVFEDEAGKFYLVHASPSFAVIFDGTLQTRQSY